MTISTYRSHLQSDLVKLKKYFYALRPILAAKWIVTHQTFPPMVLATLLELIGDRQDILAEIDRLLKIKSTADEATMMPVSKILNDFIEAEIAECERAVKLIPKYNVDSLALDRLFQEYALGSR